VAICDEQGAARLSKADVHVLKKPLWNATAYKWLMDLGQSA